MNTITKIAAWTTSGLLVAGLAAGVAEARSGANDAAGTAGALGTAAGPASSVVRLPALASGGGGGGSAATGRWARHPRLALLRRTVHGEVVLRTKTGYVTVDLRRGQVSAVSPTSITIASPDGTRQTFAIGTDTRVRIDRQPGAASAITTADRALVVAVKDGGTTARLIVVRTPGFRANAPAAAAPAP